MTAPSPDRAADTLGHDRYRRSVRRIHGADGWLLELIAPLRHVRIGRLSVGEVAEVATFCLRHLREDRAPQIAAALAFRTLFGLVPVLVVVTLAAKAMLGAGFMDAIRTLFENVGLASVRLTVQTGGAENTTIGLDQWLGELMNFASGLSVTALGWTGFVLVSLSAIWVLITIEEAFNIIFRCEYGRGWLKRLLVYWFVLTVGPLVIGLAPLLLGRLGAMTASLESFVWIAWVGRLLLSLLMLWILLFVAYVTIPATRVAWRPAMIGALVGAILLEFGKRTFGLYLEKAFGVSALYGSLGLVPLFMFWVYLMWLVILFGAEIAALLQAIRRRDATSSRTSVADSEATVRTLRVVADRFATGHTTSLAEVAVIARLSDLAASALVDRLEDAGFLRRVGEGDAVTLARPAASIALTDVLAIAWAASDRLGEAGEEKGLVGKLRGAQRGAMEGLTLDDA